MKSGLEDRNNHDVPNGLQFLFPVSMKSGLEDRNNEYKQPDLFEKEKESQ